MYSNASELADGSGVSDEGLMNFNSLKSVIFSYLTLNDILLSQVVDDEEVFMERNELANVLESFSQQMKGDFFAESTVLLRDRKIGFLVIDKSRLLLRKRLNEFLSW